MKTISSNKALLQCTVTYFIGSQSPYYRLHFSTIPFWPIPTSTSQLAAAYQPYFYCCHHQHHYSYPGGNLFRRLWGGDRGRFSSWRLWTVLDNVTKNNRRVKGKPRQLDLLASPTRGMLLKDVEGTNWIKERTIGQYNDDEVRNRNLRKVELSTITSVMIAR